jgi:membrane associated rhomboid family serine protease
MMHEAQFGYNKPLFTKWLLILNVGIFITCVLTSSDAGRVDFSPLWPLGALTGLEFAEGERLYKIFTYMFFHLNLLHIAANMIGLWFFGRVLEDHLGSKHLLGIYFAGGVTGAILWLMLNWCALTSLVGASGSVLALVFAFTALYPREKVWIFPLPMPVQARWLALGYLAITVFLALVSWQDGGNAHRIAHLAHLGGMAAGFFYVKIFFRESSLKFINDFPPPSNIPAEELGVSPEVLERERRLRRQKMEAREFMEKEVDPVLGKMSKVGYQNLTAEEKKILERAQQILGRR